jgi:hypothetical protein
MKTIVKVVLLSLLFTFGSVYGSYEIGTTGGGPKVESAGFPLYIWVNCRTNLLGLPAEASCNISYVGIVGDLTFYFFFVLAVYLVGTLVIKFFPKARKSLTITKPKREHTS